MDELLIVVFATLGIAIYHLLNYLFFDAYYAFYIKIAFILIVLSFILRYVYFKIRFKKSIKEIEIDVFDFKFYKTCNNLFNKTSYVISSFIYNSISEYKSTMKDFSINRNYGKDNSDAEYYLKLRLRWYSYIRFTYTRIKIALRKADNFSFNKQNTIIMKALSPEEKELYSKFENEVNNLENKKINYFTLRKIENYKSINYIYRYNLIKLFNNKKPLNRNIENLNFMTKKFEQYANDIRTYKRSK